MTRLAHDYMLYVMYHEHARLGACMNVIIRDGVDAYDLQLTCPYTDLTVDDVRPQLQRYGRSENALVCILSCPLRSWQLYRDYI